MVYKGFFSFSFSGFQFYVLTQTVLNIRRETFNLKNTVKTNTFTSEVMKNLE